MNFKRYVEASDTWVDSHYIMGTSTDTLTTLPAVLYPNDTTATVGLKGNMEQSGTPTPDNPIYPSECGEMTGNLFDKNTITPDKFVTTGGEISSTNYYCSDYIPVSEGAYYLANISGSSVQQGYVVYDSNKQAIRQGTISGGKSVSGVVNISANEYYIRINMYIETSPDVVMVNSGSTALPYEPYGYKIPISSANTTTPVYLGEVETTRKIGKLVLTGNEKWVSKGNPATFRYENSPILHTLNSVCYSSHFKNLPWSQVQTTNNSFVVWFTSVENTINIRCEGYSTVEDFKAFLSAQYQNGTPVTVWYVLATEETGIVNEPLRKIGDYADEVSDVSIPTIAGADSFDVLTTLKPSEVTLNYKGWHTGAVHERDSGQWD